MLRIVGGRADVLVEKSYEKRCMRLIVYNFTLLLECFVVCGLVDLIAGGFRVELVFYVVYVYKCFHVNVYTKKLSIVIIMYTYIVVYFFNIYRTLCRCMYLLCLCVNEIVND